jgi:hypothetical protein
MDLEVVIEGVSDVLVETEMKRQIRRVSKAITRPGEWNLLVSPSETRGQWDLLVRGPFGSHLASFSEGADQLPRLVAAALRACLQSALLKPPQEGEGEHA